MTLYRVHKILFDTVQRERGRLTAKIGVFSAFAPPNLKCNSERERSPRQEFVREQGHQPKQAMNSNKKEGSQNSGERERRHHPSGWRDADKALPLHVQFTDDAFAERPR